MWIHAGKEQGHRCRTLSCPPAIISELCCLLNHRLICWESNFFLETITLTILNFKVEFWQFLFFKGWGGNKAVLELYHLQGLLKLKVSACWQNDRLYRHISDKPAIWFNGVAPAISMEMSWGVAALLSPRKTHIPAILVTVSMLIWAHLARDSCFILSLQSTVSSCTSLPCPHQCTWKAQRLLSSLFLQYEQQLLSNCTWKLS